MGPWWTAAGWAETALEVADGGEAGAGAAVGGKCCGNVLASRWPSGGRGATTRSDRLLRWLRRRTATRRTRGKGLQVIGEAVSRSHFRQGKASAERTVGKTAGCIGKAVLGGLIWGELVDGATVGRRPGHDEHRGVGDPERRRLWR